MLDYVYRGAAPAETTALGAAVFALTTRGPTGGASPHDWALSGLIDEVARETNRPRIFSIACGHLREAQRSSAVLDGRIGQFIALDQDRESLTVVQEEQARFGITPLHGSVKSLVTAKMAFTGRDGPVCHRQRFGLMWQREGSASPTAQSPPPQIAASEGFAKTIHFRTILCVRFPISMRPIHCGVTQTPCRRAANRKGPVPARTDA